VAGGRSSLELSLAAAPGHIDLPWRHGRQEGGAGTLVAGSPRVEGWRGGDAQCARRSGRAGEDRGARMSAVELAGVGTCFIGPGRR
jgi:hypothetical protein